MSIGSYEGETMKFIQVVEQSGDMEEARTEIEGYFETAGDDTKVKNSSFVLIAMLPTRL